MRVIALFLIKRCIGTRLCAIKAICLDQPYPDNKVHGANMGPTLVLSAPDRPHVGPMNLAIRVVAVAYTC